MRRTFEWESTAKFEVHLFVTSLKLNILQMVSDAALVLLCIALISATFVWLALFAAYYCLRIKPQQTNADRLVKHFKFFAVFELIDRFEESTMRKRRSWVSFTDPSTNIRTKRPKQKDARLAILEWTLPWSCSRGLTKLPRSTQNDFLTSINLYKKWFLISEVSTQTHTQISRWLKRLRTWHQRANPKRITQNAKSSKSAASPPARHPRLGVRQEMKGVERSPGAEVAAAEVMSKSETQMTLWKRSIRTWAANRLNKID